MAAIAFVDVLNHLFTTLMFKIDVDIQRLQCVRFGHLAGDFAGLGTNAHDSSDSILIGHGNGGQTQRRGTLHMLLQGACAVSHLIFTFCSYAGYP